MRLIDPIELKRSIAVAVENGRAITLEEIIDEQPTIELKKGEWVDFSMSIKGVPTEACGECGEWSLGMGKNFCPNCGADMRKRPESKKDLVV